MHVQYVYENDRKAWIRYPPPRWVWRGTAICAAVDAGLPVAEYTALQVKQAVVGQGKAAKEQVQHMVVRLLNLPGAPTADAADALAIAIGTALAAWRAWRSGRAPRQLFWLAIGVGLGIVAQAVIGGLSVLAQLNPWVVGLHMVASVALMLICVRMVHLAFGLVASLAFVGAIMVMFGLLYALRGDRK